MNFRILDGALPGNIIKIHLSDRDWATPDRLTSWPDLPLKTAASSPFYLTGTSLGE